MGHVNGDDDGVGYGVLGYSFNGEGVHGSSQDGVGVNGYSRTNVGVNGVCAYGAGVYGATFSGEGVNGYSSIGAGVYGESRSGIGVQGLSASGSGVFSESVTGYGVEGRSQEYIGVSGHSFLGTGVFGSSYFGIGVYGFSGLTWAAYLDGAVYIRGPLEKPGGSFKIDHPLDPANKYLSHSFVESPDMKNVYDGVVLLDDEGEAVIDLPDWFSALNKDFRYQLTAIGAPGPNLYIAEEIISDKTGINYSSSNNNNNNNNRSHFKIAGGTSGMKVSWQVTGIRKDPWANAHRIKVEEDKPDNERGYYLHPDVYGQPEEKGISQSLFPKEKLKQEQEQPM
jgi:hypothetical protein